MRRVARSRSLIPKPVFGRYCATTTVTSWFRVSRRKASVFSSDICQVPCSAGHVSHLEARATAALEPVYNELAEALPEQPKLAIDETPFKRGIVKTWLWTFVATGFTVFVLRRTRKAVVLTSTIGADFTSCSNSSCVEYQDVDDLVNTWRRKSRSSITSTG